MSLILGNEHNQILAENRHLLVTGGPGSGKTTIALQKALKFIKEGKLNPGQQVLFLSFSKAAVGRIAESASLTNDKDFGEMLTIQTFHSFFWEVIKTHGYLIGIPKHMRILSPHDEESFRSGRDNDDKEWLRERSDMLYATGNICFDLFAETALKILTRSSVIRNLYAQKFPLIFIDEAQDTDAQQWDCIKLFNIHAQMIFLADLDQQIHDYRDDVTPERINNIIQELHPTQVSLGAQNHRSGGTEITLFARDMLSDTPRQNGYRGVSSLVYSPRGSQSRDQRIRQSIGVINQRIEQELGRPPESIAILATWGKGVKIISNALRGSITQTEIPHKVQFDETATYISSRLVAFLLEPKKDSLNIEVAEALDIMCNLYKAKGRKTEWEKFERWSVSLREGTVPNRSTVIPELQRIIEEVRAISYLGNPEKDWLTAKNFIAQSTVKAIGDFGKNAEFLMAFNRGGLIAKGLGRQWETLGNYTNARKVLDNAITETQMVSENKNQGGINVMSVHKSKGKEFDGVIIFENEYSSPLVALKDVNPYPRSRKLLLVAATRARYHVIILKDASNRCPLIQNFHV